MFTNVNRPSAVDVLRPFAVGDQFYADTTSTLAKRAIGTTNQVYTVSGGIPVWSSSITVTGLTVVDSGFTITGSSDATKTLKFEVDAQSAGVDLTIDTGAQTADRTLTIPVLAGNRTIAVIDQAQTFTAAQTIGAGTGTVFTVTASTNAAVRQLVQSTSNGTSALAELRMENDQGSANRLSFALYSSGYSGTQWGTTLANAATLVQLGASPSALFIGANTAASPIIFGLGSSEIGRWTSTGMFTVVTTSDATSSSTGSFQTAGGANIAKNLLARQGSGKGLTSTATAAGTTTLTNASTQVQIFTGATTQTLQLPAANLFGSGIGVEYIVINRSTGTVTAQRAGSDTFDGGGTTDAILTNTTRHYISNGSNQWHTIA